MCPTLSVPQILTWADAHYDRTGRWPSKESGPIEGAPGETWSAVNAALKLGRRGLPRGSSLATLLQEQRGHRHRKRPPPLNVPEILAWADAHHARTDRWPTVRSGPIPEASGEQWSTVDHYLARGGRTLPGGSSLSRLLAEQRGARLGSSDPDLTEAQILLWADAHRRRTGEWPAASSGPVAGARGETWGSLSRALARGRRGLPGGSSLAKFLAQYRGVRNPHELPLLTEDQLLAWADAHHARTGEWPTPSSGPIEGSGGETWMAVEKALRTGGRGLAGSSSLFQLLSRRRPVENQRRRPALTVERVLAWADAHRERAGHWPTAGSGPVHDAPGETWMEVDACLTHGDRGLPGGTPLARFLAEHRPPDGQHLELTVAQILAWADAYEARHGRWPQSQSGLVEERPSETWLALDTALRQGDRGMPGGSSLARLLAEHRPAPGVAALLSPRVESVTPKEASRFRKPGQPDLEIEQILAWADAHNGRTGQWPAQLSGRVAEAPHEKWANIDSALRFGRRGLPRGSSLARLFAEHRGARNCQALPPFTEPQILAWADAHHTRTGEWPSAASGPIAEAPDETWKRVADALLKGQRGLPGDSSLSALLAEQRGVRNSHAVPPITEAQILAWADAHHERAGGWPTLHSGPIPESPGETWHAVESALRAGCRGLPGGASVARLLAEHRAVPNPARRPPLTLPQILSWADRYHERSGEWPDRHCGPIEEAPGDTWASVDSALQQGVRGLPGRSSLPRLLTEHRRARINAKAPDLTEAQILAWADSFHARTGRWPTRNSGPILAAPGETWDAVQAALHQGYRGLPGGSTLARLLAEQRGVRSVQALRPLAEEQVLAWADEHHARYGGWPSAASGPIEAAPVETWAGVESALRIGGRGLPGGSSLARLLAGRRSHRNHLALPPLTIDQILAWADAHHGRTGSWPSRDSGGVAGSDGETWSAIDACLTSGKRGLPGGSTLRRLLAERRGVRHRMQLPDLTAAQVLAWADAYHARHGAWPKAGSGPVEEAPGETWCGIHHALQRGKRGLPTGSSLPRLLHERRGVKNHYDRPRLTGEQILGWADGFYERHGHWPQVRSGPIEAAPGESWSGVEAALNQGGRGLPGGSSLLRFLAEHRGIRRQRSLRLFSEPLIRGWAAAHFQRHGSWPHKRSGSIADAPEETWMGIDVALRHGYRGLPGGSSLHRLLRTRPAEEREAEIPWGRLVAGTTGKSSRGTG